MVPPAGDPVVRAGLLEINLATRAGTFDGKRLVLGPKEYLVLQILAQHAGKVVTRQQIMKQVWGGSHLDDTHYLRIVVRNLRKKIEVDPTRPRILLTELGVGYRLAPVVPIPRKLGRSAATACYRTDSVDLRKIYACFIERYSRPYVPAA